jgi:chromosome partitioning protein
MAKVICVANQKGGVGKTTTAVNLSACLAVAERRTLLIDLDPQGNASSGLGISKDGLEKNVYQALIENCSLDKTIQHTEIEHLDIVPSNIDLIGAEIEFVNMEDREKRLKAALEKVRDSYEFIVIDTPPSLGLLTINSLTAADAVLIPLQCEFYPLEGLSQLLKTINLIKRNLNPSLFIEGILLTMYDVRTLISQQVTEEIRRLFKDQVLQTIIPRSVRLSEAPSFGKPIILYDIKSKGAAAYLNLAKELISNAA